MKKIKKDVKGLIGTGALLGVGSIGVGAIGGSTATGAGAALGTVSSFMPLVGTTLMAGHTIRMVGKLPKPKKYKMKY